MLAALSPRRRRLVIAVAAGVFLALVALVVVGVNASGSSGGAAARTPVSAAAVPGPVVLVPGYGGSQTGLDQLAGRLRAAGRPAVVVSLPDGGVGDLTAQAIVLGRTVAAELRRTGARSVDIVGYSAGGIVTRLYVQEMHGYSSVRRVVTLGSPNHGTSVASSVGALVPGACQLACAELQPASTLLRTLNALRLSPGPAYVSVYTQDDETVTPPTSAVLAGAVTVDLQDVCPDEQVTHSGLPTDLLVTGIVLRELGSAPEAALGPTDCAALRAAG